MKRLVKSEENKMICGVCGGIAEYFNIDPTIVRLVVAAAAIWGGLGVLFYIVAAVVMPSS